MNVSTATPSLAAKIANLPKLAMNDLWALWDKYFPRRPPHNNRAYVEGRVAYKIQGRSLRYQAGRPDPDGTDWRSPIANQDAARR